MAQNEEIKAFVVHEDFELVGTSGKKFFKNDKGDTVEYSTVHLRDNGEILEVKASADFDFSPYVGQNVTLAIALGKKSVYRVLGVVNQ